MTETATTQPQDRPVVVVTGCSGLIGHAVMRALGPRYRVVGLDVKAPAVLPPGCSFVHCDLTDDSSVIEAMGQIRLLGQRIASVIHLAAYYDFSGEPSPLYEELTVKGTRRLLRALHQGMVTEQFVFSSTLLVMQPSTDGRPIDEGGPVAASWDYPASKLRTEAVIDAERGDIPRVILRIAGVYDVLGRSPAITEHIKRICDKTITSFFFPGDSSHGQAFVHIDDAVDAIVRVVDRRTRLRDQETFLIAEPEPMPYVAMQDVLGEAIHGAEWPTLRIPKPVAKAGAWAREKLGSEGEEPFIKPWMVDIADADYPVSIERARARLAWAPTHKLREELPEIVATMRRRPRAFFEANDMEPPRAMGGDREEQTHP